MTHEERIETISALFEFGFPIPLAIETLNKALAEEAGNELYETMNLLFQTAVKHGRKQGRDSMRHEAMEAVKGIITFS